MNNYRIPWNFLRGLTNFSYEGHQQTSILQARESHVFFNHGHDVFTSRIFIGEYITRRWVWFFISAWTDLVLVIVIISFWRRWIFVRFWSKRNWRFLVVSFRQRWLFWLGWGWQYDFVWRFGFFPEIEKKHCMYVIVTMLLGHFQEPYERLMYFWWTKCLHISWKFQRKGRR